MSLPYTFAADSTPEVSLQRVMLPRPGHLPQLQVLRFNGGHRCEDNNLQCIVTACPVLRQLYTEDVGALFSYEVPRLTVLQKLYSLRKLVVCDFDACLSPDTAPAIATLTQLEELYVDIQPASLEDLRALTALTGLTQLQWGPQPQGEHLSTGVGAVADGYRNRPVCLFNTVSLEAQPSLRA